MVTLVNLLYGIHLWKHHWTFLLSGAFRAIQLPLEPSQRVRFAAFKARAIVAGFASGLTTASGCWVERFTGEICLVVSAIKQGATHEVFFFLKKDSLDALKYSPFFSSLVFAFS